MTDMLENQRGGAIRTLLLDKVGYSRVENYLSLDRKPEVGDEWFTFFRDTFFQDPVLKRRERGEAPLRYPSIPPIVPPGKAGFIITTPNCGTLDSWEGIAGEPSSLHSIGGEYFFNLKAGWDYERLADYANGLRKELFPDAQMIEANAGSNRFVGFAVLGLMVVFSRSTPYSRRFLVNARVGNDVAEKVRKIHLDYYNYWKSKVNSMLAERREIINKSLRRSEAIRRGEDLEDKVD